MKSIKKNLIAIAVASGLSLMATTAQANEMVNPQGGVVVGYWHNWADGSGYKGGVAPAITLEQINPMYNVVDVSFMKVYDTSEGRIPTFRLDPATGLNEAEFIAQIDQLNDQGRAVLLALGGADAHIELNAGDEQDFADEIIRLTEHYGFDGLDIDLEQAAVTAADNQTVIPNALKMVKDHYKAQGKNFLITMAPEFPYLTQGGHYVPYLQNLEGYYDWINPQFYNQGGDGLWIDGEGWLAQNNDEKKQEFIYYIADSLINGTRGYYKIPHDKLVFGIPTNIDAAATGFIKNPTKLYAAFEQLKAQGQPLRGVMTWSVNWDMGRNASGTEYSESFIKDYGPFIHSQTPPEPPIPEAGKPIFIGVTDTRVQQGTAFDALSGVFAQDKEDGDISSTIVVEGSVNTHRIGDYILTYTVTDSDGNEVKQPRKVEVYSLKPELKGIVNTSVKQGEKFNVLSGVSAHDAEDGDLTSAIKISGTVDTNKLGKYDLIYSVTDSAGQTVSALRTVKIVDDSLVCENQWDSSKVYVADDVVSYNGINWRAGWWTQGDEPGTTGEYGVWRAIGDSDCGGDITPQFAADVKGLKPEYRITNKGAELSFIVKVSHKATVNISVVDKDGNNVNGGDYNAEVNDERAVNLQLNDVVVGTYSLSFVAKNNDGTKLNKAYGFNLKETLPPTDGEYPSYVAGTNYQAGDIVQGSDGNAYQCKPWPYSGWCASGSYAPVASTYWPDAWNKL